MKTLIVILVFLVQSAQASQIVSAKAAALGGTGRASAESIDSINLNPAGIALVGRYFFGSGYSMGTLMPGSQRETFSVTLTDAKPSVVLPGALGYRYHRVGVGTQTFKENEFRAGFASRLFGFMSAGIGYTHIDSDNQQGVRYRQSNFNAGVLVPLKYSISLALSGENLLKQDDAIPMELRRQSRWGLGTQYIYKKLVQVRYDVMAPLHQWADQAQGRYTNQVGLGIMMRGYFALNMGFINDDVLGQNWYTTGIAWEGPRLKFGYTLQNETRAGLGMRHLVDLWLDI